MQAKRKSRFFFFNVITKLECGELKEAVISYC